jgi:two-component system alkaline phosphatase synthesis response regulator PhoP
VVTSNKNLKRLLVVDDEPDLREAIMFDLELSGFEVLSAKDGMEGLKLAREQKPDLLILDLLLPRMDGYRVCRMLKVDKKTEKIPVIMLTAKATREDERLGKESGADLYMTKPFDPEILLENVNALLKNGEGKRKN